jgi:hypothetical protein
MRRLALLLLLARNATAVAPPAAATANTAPPLAADVDPGGDVTVGATGPAREERQPGDSAPPLMRAAATGAGENGELRHHPDCPSACGKCAESCDKADKCDCVDCGDGSGKKCWSCRPSGAGSCR